MGQIRFKKAKKLGRLESSSWRKTNSDGAVGATNFLYTLMLNLHKNKIPATILSSDPGNLSNEKNKNLKSDEICPDFDIFSDYNKRKCVVEVKYKEFEVNDINDLSELKSRINEQFILGNCISVDSYLEYAKEVPVYIVRVFRLFNSANGKAKKDSKSQFHYFGLLVDNNILSDKDMKKIWMGFQPKKKTYVFPIERKEVFYNDVLFRKILKKVSGDYKDDKYNIEATCCTSASTFNRSLW